MNELNATDTSNLEKDTNCTKTVYKRRSSVFHSRTTAFDECEGTQNIEESSTVNNKEADERIIDAEQEEEEFDLKKYIDRLREERKAWHDTYRQRKLKRKNLTKQKISLEKEGQILDLDVLSSPERAFIQARPNYDHICKSYKKLSDVALKVATLNQLAQKLNQRFVTRMEERLFDVTKKVIKISETSIS